MRLVDRLPLGQPADHLAEVRRSAAPAQPPAAAAGPRRRSTTGSAARTRRARAWAALGRRRSPRSHASMFPAAFLPCPTPTVTVRSAGTMSPPANTPGQPVIIDGETRTVPSLLELHPGHVRAGTRCRSSWPSARITVSAASVSNRPVGCGNPVSSSSIASTVQLGPVERGDRAQPVDPHALPLGLLRLLLVRRHLLTGAPVDDQRVVRAQAARHPGGVHRGVAAAVDRDPPPDHRPLARGDAAQERHRVHDPARVLRRDVDPLGQVRADRDEHRVEAALAPLGVQVARPGGRR